jgi:hypothetical protein
MASNNLKNIVHDDANNTSSSAADITDMRILLSLKNNCVKGNIAICIKPNKLRKLVCSTKNEGSVTWTQFAASLERLVAEEKVDIIANNQGEDTVTLNKKMIQRLTSKDATSNISQQKRIVEEESQPLKRTNKYNPKIELKESRQDLIRTVRIPPEILIHLTKNNQAKLHRIEQNTKTTISILERDQISGKKKLLPTAEMPRDYKEKDRNMITLTIESAGVPPSNEDEIKAKGVEDSLIIKQRKRVNFAVKLLEIMIHSFGEHPEHFQRQKVLEDNVEQVQHKQKTTMERERKKPRKFY